MILEYIYSFAECVMSKDENPESVVSFCAGFEAMARICMADPELAVTTGRLINDELPVSRVLLERVAQIWRQAVMEVSLKGPIHDEEPDGDT